ncbi:hypothetical protein ACTJI2_06005 [Pseudoxanthomonas sp. 22568]|uniref:hypothetical protein n=1 Tax=Pseudoxanthomonas TaxID=83618 RepID=UPI00193B68BB|nr:hypothetical protein [Pseudoxanthomonas beigongshangi]UBB26549.1 hypothetical protein LAG73_05555 [Pseudoxanthomonas japonensis]
MIAPASIDTRLMATLAGLVPIARACFRDPWWVIGSAAMRLAGVDGPEPNDVDLLCSARDADALAEAWTAHRDAHYRPADDGRFRSRFARFAHLPMPLEVMGDLEVRVADDWQPVQVASELQVEVNGHAIPVPTPSEQRRILLLFGRDKDLAKARRISAFLATREHHVH